MGVPRRSGTTQLSVNLVSQITDPFEVPFHLIEAVNVAMKVTKGMTSAEDDVAFTAGATTAGAGATAQVKSERMSIDQGAGASSSSSAAAAGNGGAAAADVDMGKADITPAMKDFLKSFGDAGGKVADFIKKFPQYTKEEADKAIEDLEGEGEIYNGADDETWAMVE